MSVRQALALLLLRLLDGLGPPPTKWHRREKRQPSEQTTIHSHSAVAT